VVQILLPLLARAAQSGLDALVRHFMSVLAHDDMRAVATFRVQSGMGLLHLGVQSGKVAVLAALLEESDAELWQVSCCMSTKQCSFRGRRVLNTWVYACQAVSLCSMCK